ncbi:MAG: glycosyltransferase family 4 protein, partial [Anaerolineales bacterium]|nr:glycosyltransferase family 4 protein [Anaerolineales bacterium]
VHEAGARVKYGHFFDALKQHFPLVTVHDTTLQGMDRWLNALMTIHPDRRRWRERFYKNVPAFQRRSQRVSAFVKSLSEEVDLVLQVGVLFQTYTSLPTIIYTDYTSQLSAQKPASGRSPFTPEERRAWISQERSALVKADHIFTRGEFVRQAIVADYGVAGERITAVGGGVNFADLPTVAPVPAGPPTALFIGKELYRKGGDLLLHAFAQARRQVPNARLLMLTGDTIPDDLPLAGVELIEPTWDRTAVAKLYQRAHFFVLPSRLETWGDVFLEAMAYGLPCLGVNDDAMSEIIDHEQNGLIVPPEDVNGLAQALVRLFTEQTQRQQWGTAARHKVEGQYTWAQVVAQMAPTIQRVCQVND